MAKAKVFVKSFLTREAGEIRSEDEGEDGKKDSGEGRESKLISSFPFLAPCCFNCLLSRAITLSFLVFLGIEANITHLSPVRQELVGSLAGEVIGLTFILSFE